MRSYANKCYSLPYAPFFLKHTVMMNYGGKVYTVLRGIEVILESESFFEQTLFFIYAICMLLGMYWYTRFWLNDEDIDEYYRDKSESTHVLTKISNYTITVGAALYYVFFAIMFGWNYAENQTSAAFSFCLWNIWCALNLLLATPCFKS